MSESGVIPPPEERLTGGETLTDWYIEGEIRCPDCGRYFVLNGSLDDVVKFTAVHNCAEGTMPP